MAVRIRLSRYGHRHNPWFRIVVADARAPRDGKFIEKIGIYNPKLKVLEIDLEKFKEWVSKGAQPTDSVKRLIKIYQEKLISK